jgi:hypothetical protein
VGPTQMGPIVCAEGWGSFCLIRKTENRPICVRGNDLSRRQRGGGLGIMGPGSRRRVSLPMRSRASSKVLRKISLSRFAADYSGTHERRYGPGFAVTDRHDSTAASERSYSV